ncbi:Developmental regulatory protein wetA [Paramyrothecium foliicola]|nr:Developmental regulatory protein wetA [Paramyrothecium foliicola]
MTFWTMPYRSEAVEREATFYWRDMDEDQGEASTDFFGQYVDFEADAAATTATAPHGVNPPMPTMQDSMLFEQPHDGTTSSGVSTADDFDFLSTSSQVGPSVSHDVDPSSLAVKAEQAMPESHHYENIEYPGPCHVSDNELPCLEGISLQSPKKEAQAAVSPQRRFPSPVPVTTQRKSNKFVEALSSTIRKATTMRKGRKPLPAQAARATSPTLDHPPPAMKQRASEIGIASSGMPVSPPEPGFIHGVCDDPFTDHQAPQMSPVRYFTQNGLSTPADTPALGVARSASVDLSNHMPTTSWPLQQMPLVSAPEQWLGSNDFMAGQETGWWDYNILSHHGHFDEAKHASINMGMHTQQAGLPYEYAPIPDPSTAGLMIHMPQPRPPQPTVVTDMSAAAQTYLPPPPPIPATERPHRPPRAPSSGARHRNLSSSPLKKTRTPRAPSASPTPATRHSSGGSMNSLRNASGRLPASMPGTPCSVRKRRGREASGSDEGGFVNFGPRDATQIMTGVAPSGSSKTKARREKELQEKNRRLSEAAMKIVAAAGGDVDKLAEHGFAF